MSVDVAEFVQTYGDRILDRLLSIYGGRHGSLADDRHIIKACLLHNTPREALMQLAQWKRDMLDALRLTHPN